MNWIPQDPRARRRGMIALAAALATFTTIFAFVLPYSHGRFHRKSAELLDHLPWWRLLADARPPAYDDPVAVALLILVAAGLGLGACLFGVLLTWDRPDPWTRRLVLGTAVVCTLATVLAPPTLNTNPYNFMMRARVAAAHGENPYVTPADEFPDDPMMQFANRDYTDTAGGKLPAWMIWNVAIAWVAGDDPTRNLLLLRLVLALLGLGCLAFVDSLTRHWQGDRALAGLVLWAWNPIVIANIQSRTDTVMVFYLLAALWLIAKGRRHWAVVALTLSVFVKLFTLPFLAVAALSDLRHRRWKELGIALLVCAATAVAVWLPFLEGLHGGVLEKYAGLANRTEGSAGTDASRRILQVGFALLVLVVGWTRRDVGPHLVTGWAIVSLYFSVFFAKFASSDYLLTLLAVVAPTLSIGVLLVAGALCVSFFLFDLWYLVGSATFVLPDLFPFSRGTVFLLPLLALPLVLGLVWLRRRRGRAGTS